MKQPGSCREHLLHSSTARSEGVATSGYWKRLMMSWWPPYYGFWMPSNLLKCLGRWRSLNAAFWESSQEFIFSRLQLEIQSAFGTMGSCLVKALEHGGVPQQCLFLWGLVGSWWDEDKHLLVGPAWVPSLLQAWQTDDPVNCKYKLSCKWWWAWKGGIVTMGFDYNIWIGLITYALHLQTPHSPREEWGAVHEQHTSQGRCVSVCHWVADKHLCSYSSSVGKWED